PCMPSDQDVAPMLQQAAALHNPPAARRAIGVVIPALNAAATIRRCLGAALGALDRWRAGGGEVTVVDNGSTDGTWEMLTAEYGTRVRLLQDRAATVAGLRNRGARVTSGDLLSFIDADCEIGPEYFIHVSEALDGSGADATGAPYSLPNDPHWIERTWHELHVNDQAGAVRWLYGGNLVLQRAAFDAVGGFDEELVTGEDIDLCERLRGRGFRLHQDPRVKTVHLGNPRSLGAFCRQQLWHGLGAWQSARGLDKPLVMTVAHGSATVAALTYSWSSELSPLTALGLVALAQLPVPAATSAFRIIQTRRFANPVASILLYDLYYWCRLVALLLAPMLGRKARWLLRR
ncbi:MAG: glycosyltransferase, partial [Anaerolineales bacterium]